MTENLLNQLLLTQAREMAPKSLSETVRRVSMWPTALGGPKTVSIDPDEIGQANTTNFWATYAVEGREPVAVIFSLVPVSDQWRIYPSTPLTTVEADANAAAEITTTYPWLQGK